MGEEQQFIYFAHVYQAKNGEMTAQIGSFEGVSTEQKIRAIEAAGEALLRQAEKIKRGGI